MKKLTFGFLALAVALAITPAALADTIFGFTFVGSGTTRFGALTGSGTLEAHSNGSGGWIVDSGTGVFNVGGFPSTGVVELNLASAMAGSQTQRHCHCSSPPQARELTCLSRASATSSLS